MTEEDRELLSLPIKEGGIGIHDNSAISYRTSRNITDPLIHQIKIQSDVLPKAEVVARAKAVTMQRVRAAEAEHAEDVKTGQSEEMQRNLTQITEPGASSWMGALPLSQYGFDLSKGEFQDSLCLRYLKPLKNLPPNCVCGQKFTAAHALHCQNGGFVNARHDNIRDLEGSLLKSVCNDVQIEPPLQKVTNKTNFKKSANLKDEARLDVRAKGFWRPGQNAFFDVSVTNPDCDSQRGLTVKTVLENHEKRKKRHYNQRVIDVEHGTFTPLIFTASGAMGHECIKYHKALAEKISRKKGDRYEDIMRYIRVRISFLVLKATLLCLRGSKSLKQQIEVADDFGQTLHELGV